MTQRAAPLAFPQAFQDDDDDVAWALSTAEVQWKRGAHSDALTWLHRAVEAAMRGGRRIRAFQLQQQASALQVALDAGWTPAAANEPSPAETYDDGAEPIEVDSVAVDLELPPSTAPVEPLDFNDDTELIEDIEEFDENDVIALSSSALELPPEEISEIDHPTLPPIAAGPMPEPAAEETTEPDLEPEPGRRASEQPASIPVEQPSSERSELRLRYDPRVDPRVDPESDRSPGSYAFSVFPPEAEPEQDTQRQQPEPQEPEQDTQRERMEPGSELGVSAELVVPPSAPPSERTSGGEYHASEPYFDTEKRISIAPHEPLPSSGPPTAPGGFLAPGESGPPTAPELPVSAELPPEPRLPSGPAEVGGISLADVPGLENLPDESQTELAARAEIHGLKPDEEVSGFGLALVLEGNVALMPEIADVAAARAGPGELVFAQGHLAEGVALRVVAGPGGARVAAWPPLEFESAIADCPWVGDELKFVGDRFQALAGVCMGPMGENLDDMLRNLVIERCEIRRLLPGEVIAEARKPLRGMFVLGAGRIELVEGAEEAEHVTETLSPGDFVFPQGILQGSPAPSRARAGKDGALVLFADRMVAHELMVSVPPLLEIFAR